MRVLVAHPGLQYAHQLAWALEDAGDLAAFWSGVPVVDSRRTDHGVWELFRARLRGIPLASGKRCHPVVFPLLRRALGAHIFQPMTLAWSHRLDHAFDAWAARRVVRLRPDMVVCYENTALHTFRAARKVRAICVLDAASVHYRTGREWLALTGDTGPAWIDARKEAEIGFADAILTLSPLASKTYVDAGVERAKVYVVPLGTDLPELGAKPLETSRLVRFVFVGSLMRRKAVDLLLDIFDDFARDRVPATLTCIGGIAERDLGDRIGAMTNVTHRPFVRQPELFELVATHDCLVLPSRFDSFGMVVPEAMAVGVPAVVSDRVGAKCIIERHSGAGWIVPCGRKPLEEKLRELIRRPALLSEASSAARLASRDYTWQAYRGRVVDTLRQIYRSAVAHEPGPR